MNKEDEVWIQDVDFKIVEKDLSHKQNVPLLVLRLKAHDEWKSLNMTKEQLIRLKIIINTHFEVNR